MGEKKGMEKMGTRGGDSGERRRKASENDEKLIEKNEKNEK